MIKVDTYLEPIISDYAPYGEVCPVCGALIVERCRCPQAHSKCANGHKWHYERGMAVRSAIIDATGENISEE